MQRVSRRVTTIAGAGVVALLLAGCGGSDTSTNVSDDKPKAEPAAAATATPLTLDTEPRQVQYTDRDKKAHELTVHPATLELGSADDLEGVRLDEKLRGMVPHYLTVSIANNGSGEVKSAQVINNFRLALADGTAGTPVSFFSGNPLASPGDSPLETCNGTKAPRDLAAGQEATECRVVLLPKDTKPATVSYSDESGVQLWKVEGGDAGSNLLPPDKSVKVQWKGTRDTEVPLTVKPRSVREAGPNALADYKLNARQKAATTYFVTLQYRNNGSDKLYPGMDKAVFLRTASGQTLRPLTLIAIGSRGPKGCESSVPYGMVEPGKSVRQCGVYLVGKGDKPVAVTFSSTADGAEPVTWQVP